MTKEQLIRKYEGHLIDVEKISQYEKLALKFFQNKDVIRDPNLQITLQVDISNAMDYFNAELKKFEFASFTGYLIWCTVKAMDKHPCFRYRKIEGEWYCFNNLSVFSPIAVGGNNRFSDIQIENVAKDSLIDFMKNYKAHVNQALASQADFSPIHPLVWAASHFIGNLPNLQFTGMQMHSSVIDSGRPLFYFGKRYREGASWKVPLSITFDHSNIDFYILSAYMEDFNQLLAGKSCAPIVNANLADE